ncbi:LysR family transcriptional regulator [Corynebacterium sp. 13CS0277]|uniref:LysR family transcriptional regulator n=1 Tax=Corynebacterium sp. 13CS0277 TaxID=2071994 RepID=UPI000D046D83|nr:LysR family transcriptional regulator [Corynebacterium sp. 13CS0277]PRQ11837.1 LysR family transcriptional regulator [Corynebacterium sp. 13CS0277]
MDLGQVAALAALEKEGSVSAAAVALGISQQACSARLQALSHSVGRALTARTPHGLVLTDTGRVVLGWARPVLAAAGDFDSLVSTLSHRQGLRVGASLTVAEYLLPGWLAHYPGQVQLEAANSATVLSRVAAGDLDVGFVETPTLPVGLNRRLLGWDEMVVCVAPAHPWAGTSISAAELARTPLIAREEGSGTRATVDAAIDCVEPAATVTTTAAALALVATGVAPSVLPRRCLDSRLVEVPCPVRFARPIHAVWLVAGDATQRLLAGCDVTYSPL